MFTKVLSSAILAILAARLATAQTFTDCNPLEKTCPAEAAFGKDSGKCDWTTGACDVFQELPGTTLEYGNGGAIFRINKETNAPTIATHKRMFFGRLDVELKAAPGVGVVTSVVLESADLDEIDWEWLGGKNGEVQSNYFGKGDNSTYDRGAFHPVTTPVDTFHTYSIEWTSKSIQWIIDGQSVRTVKFDEAKGGTRYPQTPMEVKIGTWVAGRKDAPQGTIDWAGGLTDFSQAPFDAIYKSISIVDYAGGDAPTKDSIKEYIYTGNSGTWESIKVVKGDGSSDGGDKGGKDGDDKEKDKTTSAVPEPTKTKTKAPEETTKTKSATKDKEEDATTTSAAPTTFATVSSSAAGPDATAPGSPSSPSSPNGENNNNNNNNNNNGPAQPTETNASEEAPVQTDDAVSTRAFTMLALVFAGFAVLGGRLL